MAFDETSPADERRWICIYPAYINSKKSSEEGRKVSKADGVENPTTNEIRDVCQALEFNVTVEANKMYSRDQNRDPQFKGRVRVQLKNEDGSPVLADIPNRKALYRKLGELIPKLKSRQQRQGGGDSSSGQQGKGKKGKKGKR
ncbi:putative signal recognition particle 19 kDa protein [Apostichopus japonicus]|uniref:Putative signal recognition particle 19 kDa protein n=1 Tax=Stichopus japonicus TaxID=307972 RepID=A0A2G8K6H1_STIJA|nr:putative signal recognition particle 19 kDa protein [Apostichopus japonicus]